MTAADAGSGSGFVYVDLSDPVGLASVLTRRCGALSIDLLRREVRVGERSVRVTPTEFSLLALLVERAGSTVTRGEIMLHLWGTDQVRGRVCDMHVANLRRKLHEAGPKRIHTVKGVGYRLEPC